MFKLFFIELVNIGSQINLSMLQSGKEYKKLNQNTVRIYHILYKTGK